MKALEEFLDGFGITRKENEEKTKEVKQQPIKSIPLTQHNPIANAVQRLVDVTRIANNAILTLDDASKMLGVPKSFLYKMTIECSIPNYKPFGKTVYYDKQELINWIKERK